jgi:hypothetical protein
MARRLAAAHRRTLHAAHRRRRARRPRDRRPRFADEAALAARLAGWEDVAGTDGSVHWLLERLGLDDSHLPATASAGYA